MQSWVHTHWKHMENMGEHTGVVISRWFPQVLLNKHCQTPNKSGVGTLCLQCQRTGGLLSGPWQLLNFLDSGQPKAAPYQMVAIVVLLRNHDWLCLLPMSNYDSKSQTRQGLEKSWSYKIHKQADPSPQISLISVLFHRIATTHIHSNYGRGLNKPLWFHGIKSNWLPDCNSSSLIKRLRAEGSDLSSGPIVYNINKMWRCRLMSC